nr:cellulosome protein dockerin type I [Myxococcota bacterium]
DATRAPGGAFNLNGGDGGAGSGGATLTGDPGSPENGAGGGGGGGAGYIYVKGTLTGAGTISPAPAVTP